MYNLALNYDILNVALYLNDIIACLTKYDFFSFASFLNGVFLENFEAQLKM